MGNNDRLSRLAQRLGERLQDASHAPEELQRGVHQAMRGAFDRMELVSREDFDILMDVLQRTRARVEALETQVASLEAALATQTSRPSTPSSSLTPGAASTQSAASTTTPSGPPTQSAASTATPSATQDGPAPAEDAGAGEAGDGSSTRG